MIPYVVGEASCRGGWVTAPKTRKFRLRDANIVSLGSLLCFGVSRAYHFVLKNSRYADLSSDIMGESNAGACVCRAQHVVVMTFVGHGPCRRVSLDDTTRQVMRGGIST